MPRRTTGLILVIADIEFNSTGRLTAEDIADLSVLAEEKGFGTVWTGESNIRDPTILSAAIAAKTRSVKIGTAILHIWARSPVSAGYLAATMDELSHGRFILGLGVSNKVLAGWHGFAWDHPIQRMKEYVDVVRRVYVGEKVNYKGQLYASNGFHLTFSAPSGKVTIFLAALGERMSRLAGQISDGIMINQATEDELRTISVNARKGAKSVGKNPDSFTVVGKLRCSVNSNLQVAKDTLKRVVAYYGMAYHYRDMYARMGFAREVQKMIDTWKSTGKFSEVIKNVPDRMLNALPEATAGSFHELRKIIEKRLDAYEKVGATRMIIAYVPSTDTPTQETKSFLESW